MKKYKVRVIHLSHTDIGYKDTQIKIKNLQISNLLDIINGIERYDNFSWNIESFGILYEFLKEHPNKEGALVKLIKDRKIGLSTNFWNYTKIASPTLIEIAFKKVKSFVSKNKLEKYASSMITNDINGYSKDWAIKAYESGTKNMYFGIHWSHGYYPAWKKQEPFYWEVAKDKKILVWIGEQYAVGNNMGIVPGPISDYISSDGLTAGDSIKEQISLANKRIKELINQLEIDNYQFDVIPITVLGTGSDNDPINYDIAERVKLLQKEWSSFGVEEVTVTTLQEFFDEVNQGEYKIPTYKGEWPDWWADGAASNPFALKAFKESQRVYETLLRLGSKNVSSIEDNLLLYAEHTYATEWATFKPYSFYNKQTEELKKTYALKGLEESQYLLDKILKWKSYKVADEDVINLEIKNISNAHVNQRVDLKRFIGLAEHSKILGRNILISENNNKKVPFSLDITEHPIVAAWSEKDIVLHLDFKPNETKDIKIDIHNSKPIIKPIANQYQATMGRMKDDIVNIKVQNKGISYSGGIFESKVLKMKMGYEGIEEFNYLGQELASQVIPFVPVRYIDKKPNDYKIQYNSRGSMGRNIISEDSIREMAKYLSHSIKISDDKNNAVITMNYKLNGCDFIRVIYKVSEHDQNIDVSVQMLKIPTWSNETLFLSMPQKEFEIEYGSIYKVNEGQIPGTLLSYHSLNEGVVYDKFKINHLDSSLLYTGKIIHSNMKLAHDPTIDNSVFKEHYAILTSNNWETNFSVDQGGFHEFRFILSPVYDKANVTEELFAQAMPHIVKRK